MFYKGIQYISNIMHEKFKYIKCKLNIFQVLSFAMRIELAFSFNKLIYTSFFLCAKFEFYIFKIVLSDKVVQNVCDYSNGFKTFYDAHVCEVL